MRHAEEAGFREVHVDLVINVEPGSWVEDWERLLGTSPNPNAHTVDEAIRGALTPEEALNYRGPDREQKLIEGARKEGQVVLYSALIVNQMLRPLTAGFMKKYPFLKMTYYRADSEELLAKLSAEIDLLVRDEWFASEAELVRMAVTEFLRHHRPNRSTSSGWMISFQRAPMAVVLDKPVILCHAGFT